MFLRNPDALYLLIVPILLAAVWFWRRGRSSAGTLALRLAMVGLVALALADPAIVRHVTTGNTLVVLVDQSDSLGEPGKAALREQAAALTRTTTGEHQSQAHVIYFGGNIANPEAEAAGQPALRADQTDIAGALDAARGLIGTGSGRVLLLSDGMQTRNDALAEARALAKRRIPIDTLAYLPPDQPEIWIVQVEAPATLRVGETYTVQVVIGSTQATTAQVRIFDGDTQIHEQTVVLSSGENRLSYQQSAVRPGIARLRAEVSGQPDGVARNNSAAATALVAPPPRVLLAEGRDGQAQTLRDALREAGIDSDRIAGADLPAQISRLDAYDGVVLIDVPAGNLSLDQMTTLREFVRSEGRGLVATGGRASLTLGAYKGTPLEDVLPVEMTPPPRPERSDVTLLLIIDRSASMGVPDNPTKFDMAKEAAILAAEGLRQNDRIGVLTFDTNTEWTVPFQQIGAGLSAAQVQEQISQIALGGGTDIYTALTVGLSELVNQPGQVRHAVLLTDGRSFTSAREPYRTLIEQARAQNITLSSIAIGDDADTELLQELAQWGAGRYHFAGKPEDIPRLTLLESEIARTEPQIEGAFRADQPAPHPLLRDFRASQLPGLNGYVGTTIKPDAELVLRSPDEDPILAVWQYGLGRAVAWTPSVGVPWADGWSTWPEYGAFWAQVIRYTLPEPDSGALRVRVTPSGSSALSSGQEVRISADSLAPSGAPLDLADTEATITLPDGTIRNLALRQTAPGQYEQRVALPSDGPYAVEVRQRKGELTRETSAGYVQRYSDEYLPSAGGADLLAEVSRLTGGQALRSGEGTRPENAAVGAPPLELWPWLLLAALGLWLLELAVRRTRLRRANP